MKISDTSLAEMASLSVPEIRIWLRERSPEQDSHYWWENVMARALNGAYLADVETERRNFACLALAATEEAVSRDAMEPIDGAIRIANLAAAYLQDSDSGNSLFDVNSIVSRCLDLIDVSLEDASAQAPIWKALNVEQMQTLRKAKNLAYPCSLLADRVTGSNEISRLARWLNILDQLP